MALIGGNKEWKRTMTFTLNQQAEIDRLRAELTMVDQLSLELLAELAERDAAIARVRGLCNESEQGYDWSCFPADVLRALDGVE
jgi:hypothetical protein